MPKMKTNRGARKRFKITGTGKVKRAKAYTGHLKTCKKPTQKRNLRKPGIVHKTNETSVKRMLPGY